MLAPAAAASPVVGRIIAPRRRGGTRTKSAAGNNDGTTWLSSRRNVETGWSPDATARRRDHYASVVPRAKKGGGEDKSASGKAKEKGPKTDSNDRVAAAGNAVARAGSEGGGGRRKQKGSSKDVVSKEEEPRLRLIMLRHAKSAWDQPELGDHARPLAARGVRGCRSIAEQLWAMAASADDIKVLEKDDDTAACWVPPDVILCSNSTRTRQTLDEMLRHQPGIGTPVVWHLRELYDASHGESTPKADRGRAVISLLAREIPDAASESGLGESGVGCVMCVGHNFGWEEAVSLMTGQEVTLKTANAALLSTSAVGGWRKALGKKRTAGGWGLDGVLCAPNKKGDAAWVLDNFGSEEAWADAEAARLIRNTVIAGA